MTQAAYLTAKETFEVGPSPELHPLRHGEVRIRVLSVGVCGSDIHMYQDYRIGDTSIKTPLILGHEFCGEVTEVAEGTRSGDHQTLRVGDRVAVEPHVACSHCRQCEEGHPNLCTHHTFLGVYPHHGALQETLTVPAKNCFILPDEVSNDAGALLEALGVALHAVRLGQVDVGDRVAVIGAGPIGLLLTRLLSLSGVTQLSVIEPLAWRRKAAGQWGATDTHEASYTMGSDYDVVFEAAWAGSAVQLGAELCRPGARLVLVGIPGDDRCEVQHALARRKGLTLVFARRMKHTYPACIRLVQTGQVKLEEIVSHIYPLAEVQQAFKTHADLMPEVLKVVVRVTETSKENQ